MTGPRPPLPTIDEIKSALTAQVDRVAETYAPGGQRRGPQYYARNPGRHDNRIGSFWVNLSGPHVGRWRDASTEEGGDLLDLIALATGRDIVGALAEARSFLGIDAAETPAQRALRQREAARARAAAEAERAQAAEAAARTRRRAHALWLGAQEIEGTPAAAYLAGRCVGPADLGRPPRALRFHPECPWREDDPDTGEVHEARLPAMLALIHGPARPPAKPEVIGVHRTYLAEGPGGWAKAPVRAPRKVLGSFGGGAVRVWRGWNARGGKGARLGAGPDQRVYIAEGIEDALSAAVLLGEAPAVILAAVSLGNIGAVVLPATVREVTIIADNDPGPKQRAVVDRAVAALAGQGRTVRVWRAAPPHKDLNDALRAARAAERQAVPA